VTTLTNTRILTWIINQDDSCELQLPSTSWGKVSATSILACSVNIGIVVVKGLLILVMFVLGLHIGSNQLIFFLRNTMIHANGTFGVIFIDS
jgi:hypothetical protein